jgi:hypothetical protein
LRHRAHYVTSYEGTWWYLSKELQIFNILNIRFMLHVSIQQHNSRC